MKIRPKIRENAGNAAPSLLISLNTVQFARNADGIEFHTPIRRKLRMTQLGNNVRRLR